MFAKRITIHLFFFFSHTIFVPFLSSTSLAYSTRRAKYYVDINFADRAFKLSHASNRESDVNVYNEFDAFSFLLGLIFCTFSLSLSFSFARLLAFFPSLFLFCLVVSMPFLLILSHLRHVTSLMRTIAKYNKFQIALQRIRLISIHHRIRRQHQSISTGCWLFSLLAYRIFSNVLSSQGRNGENESERFRI